MKGKPGKPGLEGPDGLPVCFFYIAQHLIRSCDHNYANDTLIAFQGSAGLPGLTGIPGRPGEPGDIEGPTENPAGIPGAKGDHGVPGQ